MGPPSATASPSASTSRSRARRAIVVQGHQNGRGWTMVIDRETGHLSATLTETPGAFILAGACLAE